MDLTIKAMYFLMMHPSGLTKMVTDMATIAMFGQANLKFGLMEIKMDGPTNMGTY